jgi:polyisoprenoid-binding protein YceI
MQRPKSTGPSPVRIIIAIVAIAAVLGAGALAFIWFSGGSGEASQPVTAPTLAPAEPAADATPEAAATEEAAEPAATPEAAADEPAATPEAAATEEAAAAQGAAQTAAAQTVTYSIVAEESEVSFSLDEDLRGERVTVVGTTNQVAGQVRVDFSDPSASQVGTIRINVRTLATDNEFRDRAIRGQILRSQQPEFEFAQFVPTSISGLPDSVAFGDTVQFEMVGDLTLRDVTQPVTWQVTVTPVSETRLEGTATATIQRTPFGLEIPSVPGVANVTEDVELAIEFVATAEDAGA